MRRTGLEVALPAASGGDGAAAAGCPPRRVLHVLDGLSGGGAEEWVRDLVALLPLGDFTFTVCYLFPNPGRFQYAAELQALGARVAYVGLRDQWFAELAPRHPLVRFALRAVRSPYYRWIRPWARHLVMFARLWREIRRTRPDVVHCHVFHAFVYGVLAARAARVPLVVYTAPALRAQLDGRYRWVFLAYRRLGRLVDRFVTAISVEELEQEAGVPTDRIILLRGAVDFRRVRRVPRETNPVVREFGLAGAFPIILLAGRFSAEKGQAVAVRAARELRVTYPDLRLILLGEGEEREAIRALVAAEGLEGTVILPGFRTDLEHFYGLADLYWRTSLTEGMNRACFLAMAYGLPIVAFDTRAPTEVLEDGETVLLVPSGDHASLAAASRRLLASPAWARAIGAAAAERCRRDWDIDRAIQTFAELYRCGAPPRTRGRQRARES
ncbi:MAG: glycosyltransferase [Candidatus Methylomirabilales bacterium]